ncbi:unnamed protein product [Parascedosporium putredinis]|uniref:RanBD1 domain-containing protein n=1 Tax=Parascedosporium putredinis TaxID=1442378 RepID=A0A9P1H4G9_9PEZI|nr:unnamed protein product [Parascedosporium putredinis]CAI7995677.1 unnamed protein product [Parascedosporium putredinis]
MAGTTANELFKMVIPSPPRELTGAALTKDIPKDLDQHGSVFADQYLSHLCPKDFNDLQRRQFFCILDLRRLKHAANEIFSKKDWKLNIMNFAKEFEKSRSLIMLRYGLYEFKNVRPSADVLRKWRAAHGLHDEEPADRPKPAKASNKRKADDELDHTAAAATELGGNKRRATDRDADAERAPSYSNKRKPSINHDQSSTKTLTPSITKSVFEKIASKPATFTAPSTSTKPVASSTDNNLARSILDKNKLGGASGNIFGYLSDASSAKNSGVDADGESETESEAEEDAREAGKGAAAASSKAATNPFASKTSSMSGFDTGASSTASEVRETTPGRSLFDRVTKGSDGQPVRVNDKEEEAVAPEVAPVPQATTNGGVKGTLPANKTWTPDTPLKFAAQPTQSSSLFGAASTPSGSLFGSKPAQPASNLFGAAKPAKTTDEKPQGAGDADQSGGESDKENASRPVTKSLAAPFESTRSSATPQPPTGSLFKSPAPEPPKNEAPGAAEAQKPAEAAPQVNLFGNKPTSANMFAAQAQSGPTPAASFQSSTLFGTKSSEPSAPTETPKTASLFGTTSTPPGQTGTDSSKPLFGNAGAAPTEPAKTGSLFGNGAKPASGNLFGTSSGAGNLFGSQAQPSQPTPTFSFGASTTSSAAPAPIGSQTPKASKPDKSAMGNALFGSPMKQDGPSPGKRGFGDAMQEDQPSPVKKPFGAGASSSLFGSTPAAASANGSGTALFNFGATPAASNGSASSLFGGNSAPATGGLNFNFTPGGGSASAPSSFTFGAGAADSTPAAPSAGGMFNFGATPSQPATGGSFTFASANPFAFSGTPGGTTTTPSGRQIKRPNFAASKARARMGSPAPPGAGFGGAQPNAAAAPAPSFSFSAASPQPQGGQQNLFGSNANGSSGSLFSGLQAPPGGTSTTGTSIFPFNFGGASSLATTPATGTPEPTADADGVGSTTSTTAPAAAAAASKPTPSAATDGDAEAPQEQINLVEGGPGEEDETVVHDVRAKIMKFETPESGEGDGEEKKAKSPWSTKGVGPLRLLKHKTTGAVRVLLRREPTGQVALNRAVLPGFTYKAEEKYVKLTTSNDAGTGLETWMVQVKTKDLAKELAEALEKYKSANDKS